MVNIQSTGVKALIGIGAPKCGSTFLFNAMKLSHELNFPDAKSGNNGKELNFFTENQFNLKDAVSSYLNSFHQDNTGALCECSPSYFSDPQAPKRINSVLPNSSIFVVLRDPAQRSYSAFLHHKRAGRIGDKVGFWEAVKIYPNIIADSRYELHLENYIKIFGHERISMVLFEDLVRLPGNSVNSILVRNGLKTIPLTNFDQNNLEKNSAFRIRCRWLHKLFVGSAKLSRSAGLDGPLKALSTKAGIGRFYKQMNFGNVSGISPKLQEQLDLLFATTKEYVAESFGYSFINSGGKSDVHDRQV